MSRPHPHPHPHTPALERRIASAIRRIGDASTIDRVGAVLAGGDETALFALLLDDDDRVVAAAHECAILRLGRVVGGVARAFGFDEYQRDELLQRTFVDLPAIVARVAARGEGVVAPDAWLRRRAQFTAHQMCREERGDDISFDERHDVALENDDLFDALDHRVERAWLDDALETLARERPVLAKVLRLHYIDGHSLAAVAQALGRTHGTVRNDAQRGRVRLAAIIRAHHPDLVPEHERKERKNARS